MSEQTLQEVDELRRQVERLQAENLESQKKLRDQDDRLGLLLLLLAVDRGIYVVRKPGSSEWGLLSKEKYKRHRGERLPASKPQKMPASPRKRAA
jgi:hypothetical protein